MGKVKAEKGSSKWLANKMKSKGLQKLRWYCQMCQKQCRDQNGFKCHISSESHQRQMLLFGEKPAKFLNEFSKEFHRDFMDILKRCHGTKRVFANAVYQEYIRDKNHVRMNATKWVTLSGFCKYLGSSGQCKIDETEKGYYITWIDRNPETLARQEALEKRDKMSKDDDERMADFVAKQVEREILKKSEENLVNFTELLRGPEDKIKLESMKIEKKQPEIKNDILLSSNEVLKKPSISKPSTSKSKKNRSKSPENCDSSRKRKKSKIEELIEEETREKIQKEIRIRERQETSWLKKGIILKITTKSLGEKYYKQKVEVIEVIDRFKALVKLNQDNSKVMLDQNDLETVIPAVGRQVLVLSGKYRGYKAILENLDVENFQASLKLCDKNILVTLPYEHFSKLGLAGCTSAAGQGLIVTIE